MVIDRLTEFLRTAASREFRLGEWDCGLWLADWYVAATGNPDPAAHLRAASYSADELSARMLPIIETLGLEETQTPTRGDIGMLRLANRDLGAIWSGRHWMVIGHGLKAIPPIAPVKAWKVA